MFKGWCTDVGVGVSIVHLFLVLVSQWTDVADSVFGLETRLPSQHTVNGSKFSSNLMCVRLSAKNSLQCEMTKKCQIWKRTVNRWHLHVRYFITYTHGKRHTDLRISPNWNTFLFLSILTYIANNTSINIHMYKKQQCWINNHIRIFFVSKLKMNT